MAKKAMNQSPVSTETINVLKLQQSLEIDSAKAAQTIEQTLLTLQKNSETLIPNLTKHLESLSELKKQFEVEKLNYLNEINSLTTKIEEKTNTIEELDSVYNEKLKEKESELLISLQTKQSEYKRNLVDIEHQYNNDVKTIGEKAFVSFLEKRNLETVSKNELNDLRNYKRKTESEIQESITKEVDLNTKNMNASKAIAINSIESNYKTQLTIKDSELEHKIDLIKRLEADKEKLEQQVIQLQSNMEKIVSAARSGGSNVTVDAKTTK
jgi:hypothetical protein